MFTVRKNVPLPPHGNALNGPMYPFVVMDVGDMFEVPASKGHAVSIAMSKEHAKGPAEFTRRRMPSGGWGIWRTA